MLASINRFKLDLFNYNAEELKQKLSSDYSHSFHEALNELLAKNNLELREDLKLPIESLLEKVEEEALKVEVLELVLAFDPTDRFLGEIKNWIRKNVEGNVLLELKVRESIIGGAELVYKGLYKDLTISNRLEDFSFQLP